MWHGEGMGVLGQRCLAYGGAWWIERDRMAQGEPNQLYWAGFFLFGPFPEENMFGFS